MVLKNYNLRSGTLNELTFVNYSVSKISIYLYKLANSNLSSFDKHISIILTIYIFEKINSNIDN